jgi:hypothetical protein
MAEFRLSTLDQNAPKKYLRYTLCFAAKNSESTNVTERLQRAAKSFVSEVPMIAGTVITNDQQKPASVTVTPKQIEEFAAIIKHLEDHTQSYKDICHGGIAPRHIEGIDLTPLANDSEGVQNPSCAIQANFIDGGLLLVIYLHHAVADIHGMSTILRLMSEGLPLRKFDHDALQSEATVVSQARSRLSHSSGAPAFLRLARDIYQRHEQSIQHQQIHHNNRDEKAPTASNSIPKAPSNRSAIFAFRLDTLAQTTEMLNSRRIIRNPNSTPTDKISPREVLIAILWRSYARAKWQSTNENYTRTSISFPVNLRNILIPPLDIYWMGNAQTTALANDHITSLTNPYNLPNLEQTAKLIHTAAQAANSDLLARSRISLLNSELEKRDWVPTPQLVVHDWTSLVPVMERQKMDLRLGLGRPDAIRRTGRGLAGNEVVLLPVNRRMGVLEV